MGGYAVSASPPASRAAMGACSCSRLSALLHTHTHTHTHTSSCSSTVPSGSGNHTPVHAFILLIILSIYCPRADFWGSRQGCPGPRAGGEAVAALPQHLFACGHVQLRAAGMRHKAVAGVHGLDRGARGEAATETSCRNTDTVHPACFKRGVHLQPAGADLLSPVDILRSTTLLRTQIFTHSYTRYLYQLGADRLSTVKNSPETSHALPHSYTRRPRC